MLRLIAPLTLVLGLSPLAPVVVLAPGPDDLTPTAVPEGGSPVEAAAPAPIAAALVGGVAPLRFDVGGLSLLIPRDEHLTYGVHVAVGPVGATVGTVTLDTNVEPFRESLVLLGGGAGGDREIGNLTAKAEGSYLFYSMETTLDSRYLPQAWPSISHYYKQSGSENRRREVQLGELDGQPTSVYRRDTREGAPAGQRIWAAKQTRDIPAGTLDMLGAVYLARTLVMDGAEDAELVFPLIDKTRLWQMRLTLAEERRVEVPAGTFDAVEVQLLPEAYPGEPEHAQSKFRGLFGISGTIKLWVERTTGVPVRIAGTIPAGPVEVECDIFLEGHLGTPDAFRSVVPPEPAEDAEE